MREVTEEEYKEIILKLLCEIHKICSEYGLKYFIFYGTLLGAIRHGGFIPWDDDIDIVMPRRDYDELKRIIDNLDCNMNFIDISNHKDTIYPYGKICFKETELFEYNFKHVKDYGAFIDVFPLDCAPKQKWVQLLEKRYLRFLAFLMQHSSRCRVDKTASAIVNVKRKIAFEVCKLVNTQNVIRKIDAFLRNRNRQDSQFYRILWGNIFPADMFNKVKIIEFENFEFCAPENAELILSMLYGEYMKLPDVSKRASNHEFKCYIREE